LESVTAMEAKSHMQLDRIASTFVKHSSECSQQLSAAEGELVRLQTLLDESMGQMAEAFGRLVRGGAGAGTDDGASDVMVTTLQYQDICSQLVAHLRERLARTGMLVDGLNIPFEAAMATMRGDPTTIALASSRVNEMEAMLSDARRATSSGPVQQAQVGYGDVELF
jgi:hypothetical protein